MSFVNHNRPLPPITIEDLNEKTDFDDRKYLNEELKGMFFSLDLIQSYGSGIRRAKQAMEDNNSPRLVFGPDNDSDDYTQVIAYINSEFASIKAEEEGKRENVVENVVVNLPPKVSVFLAGYSGKKYDIAQKLVKSIQQNSHITIAEMSEAIGITDRTVQRYLREFQDNKVLTREGSDKNGEWILF